MLLFFFVALGLPRSCSLVFAFDLLKGVAWSAAILPGCGCGHAALIGFGIDAVGAGAVLIFRSGWLLNTRFQMPYVAKEVQAGSGSAGRARVHVQVLFRHGRCDHALGVFGDQFIKIDLVRRARFDRHGGCTLMIVTNQKGVRSCFPTCRPKKIEAAGHGGEPQG